jgi:hypothetical protein
MEASFADAANNHHFKRARWRRLWRQQIQDYLIAAIQNVRILLAHQNLKPSAAAALLPPIMLTKSLLRGRIARLIPLQSLLWPNDSVIAISNPIQNHLGNTPFRFDPYFSACLKEN